ncbi:MAG: shikimate kinase AroK [Pseudomonadota bacterium]
MPIPDNIYLVGPMGAGKSTVGRQLAKQLRKDFIDCDTEIERRTGASIPLIFEIEGEEGFRRRETTVLAALAERRGVVLATGGGAVLASENREVLSGNGFVIYLASPAELLYERTYRDKNRPLLQTEDPLGRLQALVAERDPLYREVADLVMDTNRRTSRYTVRDIVRAVERHDD